MQIYNKFLTQIQGELASSSGLSHWIVQRLSALSIFILVSSLVIFDSIYAFAILAFIVSVHIFVGMSTLVDDYVHDDHQYIYGITFIRVLIIFLLKTIFIIFI